MHVHAALCQILSRSSVGQLPPEDAGWKDTVLVNPNETVRILTRFDTHSGVFVHHCHNLEHEDAGMMQNFEVLPPPSLDIQRNGRSVTISWPDTAERYSLESSPTLGASADWRIVAESPVNIAGRWAVTVTEPTAHRVYRLMKP